MCGEMVGGWMDGKERGRVNESKRDEGEGRGRGGQRKGRAEEGEGEATKSYHQP